MAFWHLLAISIGLALGFGLAAAAGWALLRRFRLHWDTHHIRQRLAEMQESGPRLAIIPGAGSRLGGLWSWRRPGRVSAGLSRAA